MLVKNSIIYGTMSIIRGMLAFLVVTVYTRLLTPADYGDYAVLLAIVGFMDSFLFMGVRHSIMRHITHTPKATDHAYLVNAIFMYVLESLFCLLLFFVLTRFNVFQALAHTELYAFAGLMIAGEAFSQLVIIMARIRLRNAVFFILNIMRSIISVSVGYVLITSGMGLQGAVFAFLCSTFLSCVVGIIGAQDFKNLRVAMIDRKIIGDIIRFALPLVFVLSVQSAVHTTDRLLLDYLIGGDATGLYAASQDVPSRLINMLIVAIHIAAYQLAVNKLDHEGEEACKTQLRQNYTLLLGLGLPATAGIVMLAPGLANLFLGEKFRPFFIQYAMLFAPLAFINSFLQHYFILSYNFAKKNHMMMAPFTGALIIKVVGGYFGILHFGVMGAIMASYAAYVFLLVASIIRARNIFRMPVPLWPTVQIAAATVLMAAGLHVMDLGHTIPAFMTSALIGVTIYGGTIMAFNTGNIRTEIIKFIQQKRK